MTGTCECGIMDLRFPQNVENVLNSRESVSFSRRTLLHGVSKLVGIKRVAEEAIVH